MMAILSFILLIYIKKSSMNLLLSWSTVIFPLQCLTFLVALKVHETYKLLKQTHKIIYDRLTTHLVICTVLLGVFLSALANYLTYYSMIEIDGRLTRFSPLYVVIFSTFGIFLYLLPGLSDPEINTSKRVPFLAFNYFLFSILWLNFFSFNGIEVFDNGSSGLVVFLPPLFTLSVHLVSLISEMEENKTEFTVTLAAFIEVLFVSLEWNDSIIIRLVIALMTWIYVYYCWVHKIRLEKLLQSEQT